MKFDEETVKELEAIRIAFGFKTSTRAAAEAIHRLGWPFVNQSPEAIEQIQKTVKLLGAMTQETTAQIVKKVEEEEAIRIAAKPRSMRNRRKPLYKDKKPAQKVIATSHNITIIADSADLPKHGIIDCDDNQHWAPDEYSQ